MEKKTKSIFIRMTPSQLESLKKRSAPFGTMTNFINNAIDEFSDTSATQLIDISNHIVDLYASIDSKLAHIGGNLNQAMRRINETAAARQPYGVLLKAELAPKVESCSELCNELRLLLRDITSQYTK